MSDLLATHRCPPGGSCFYRRALAFCAMIAMAMVFRSEDLTDWDAWDYTAQALTAHSSDLLLGRWWFIATMRGVYLAARPILGLQPTEGYLAMQAACTLMMALAVVAGMAWTYRLTRSAAAEVLFAAMVIPGPSIAIYASAVMTESMTFLMISLAMLLWEYAVANPNRAAFRALLAGFCFGVAVDIREPVIFLAAWPIVSCFIDRPPRRGRLLAVACGGAALTLGIGILGAWAWYPWYRGYFANILAWARSMAEEREQFGLSIIRNLGFLGLYCLAAAPAAMLATIPGTIWSAFRRRRLCWLALSMVPFVVSLLLNHDLSINPRHPLALAWMLLPVAAGAVSGWIVPMGRRYRLRLGVAVGLVLAVGGAALAASWGTIEEYYFAYADSQHRIFRALLPLPRDAVIVAGPGTPVATYLNIIGEKDFNVVRSGWSWPGDDLRRLLEQELAAGKSLYVNLDKSDWTRSTRKSPEWDQLCSAVAGYVPRPSVWPMFEMRRPPTSAPAASRSASPSAPAITSPR